MSVTKKVGKGDKDWSDRTESKRQREEIEHVRESKLTQRSETGGESENPKWARRCQICGRNSKRRGEGFFAYFFMCWERG